MARAAAGLALGERLHAHVTMSFRGSTAASAQSTFALRSLRNRQRQFQAWFESAQAAGFPALGPDMVLGVTDERLLVWRPSFFLSRPGRLAGAISIATILDVACARRGFVTSLSLLFEGGRIVEFEAMRGRKVRRFAALLAARRDGMH